MCCLVCNIVLRLTPFYHVNRQDLIQWYVELQLTEYNVVFHESEEVTLVFISIISCQHSDLLCIALTSTLGCMVRQN